MLIWQRDMATSACHRQVRSVADLSGFHGGVPDELLLQDARNGQVRRTG